jgi:hypothetical protein
MQTDAPVDAAKRGKRGPIVGRQEAFRKRILRSWNKLADKLVEKALEGDTKALATAAAYVASPPKANPVSLMLPRVESLHDVPRLLDALVQGVGAGKLTPSEARDLADGALKLLVIAKGMVDSAVEAVP